MSDAKYALPPDVGDAWAEDQVAAFSHADTELAMSPSHIALAEPSDVEAAQGLFSRTKLFWPVTEELRVSLDEQFDRYDLNACGFIQHEAELKVLATNTAHMAFTDPHNLNVGASEIDKFVDLCRPLLQNGDPKGVNKITFINVIVYVYGFKLQDPGSEAARDMLRLPPPQPCTGTPLGDPQLQGFVEWWEGECLNTEQLAGSDEQLVERRQKAQIEYKCVVVRRALESERSLNVCEWRQCIREQACVRQCEQEEQRLAAALLEAKMTEKLAQQDRLLVGSTSCWLLGASCIRADTRIWQACSKLRGDPAWQWFMLIVNLINVLGLMSADTSCDPGDCGSTYHDTIVPILDMAANVLFTVDMVNSMVVLGFASYFHDAFNKLDFFVVLTGWLDAAGLLSGLDVSALRALRVLRPMRLVKYFKGIQAIIGAIYFNLEPIWNVIQFMLFFLIIFGIAGVTLFPGQLQHRCVVDGPYLSQTAGVEYSAQYADTGAEGSMGELMYFCTANQERVSFPFPYRCASYMSCDESFGNPHHGATSFDNFGSALLLMFQVQTLSTWWEFDYATQMTVGWYGTVYYQMIIFLVGFIVSQLFVAVVCFGFENLEEQLSVPSFSDDVIGLPYVEAQTDPEDNLCACLNKPFDPLDGAEQDVHPRGTRDGLRVSVQFLVHDYPPAPLDAEGCYDSLHAVELQDNPAAPHSTLGECDAVPDAWADTELQADPDAYSSYRRLMGRWKAEKAEQQEQEVNRPFRAAHEVSEPRRLTLGFDALKAWSHQTVHSLQVMLRAQEQIDGANIVTFFHDSDGKIGAQMKSDQVLADLVKVVNRTDMPTLVVHMRPYIKVSIELLTAPSCELPSLSLAGSESIRDVKQLCFDHLQEQGGVLDDSVELEHCRLFVDGDIWVEEDASLFGVCLETVDNFDPMVHEVFFAMTIDKKESFILSSAFDNTIIAIICLNSIFLAIDHYNPSDSFILMLEVAEWIFNVVFTIEMGLKLYCLKGFCNYWRFNSNKFDFVIVASSWGNILTESIGLDLAFMKVLRIFRALRVTRVLRKIESVRQIIDAAFDSMQPILNIMMFMLVVLIVYSCMGMQLYGSMFDFDGAPPPRENFDNFVMAFLGLFQVLTGSSWELVLYDCMRAKQNSYLGVPFILSFFIVCNYIILNLFIGAILANMGTGTDEERLEMTQKRKRDEIIGQRLARESQLFVNSVLSRALQNGADGEDLTTLEEVMEQRCARDTFMSSPIEESRLGLEINNKALGCFSAQSPFRRAVYRLVKNDYFDFAILIVIVYSTILLTLLNPDTARDDAWQGFFRINDIVFLAIFTVEFVMKLVAFGFIWCDNIEFMLADEGDLKELMLGDHGVPSYMYDSWNYLDLVVLFVSWINMFAEPEGPLKILRLLRAFRPLRMVNRVDGMKLVIMSLVDAGPALGNVCVLLFSVFLIFGILGLNLFVGKFQSCNDVQDAFVGGSNLLDCHGHTTTEDYWTPKVWSNPSLGGWGTCSFDNIWVAFMALFEVSSGDSWESVMYLMADVPAEAGETPYRDDGPLGNCLWAFFAVIFVFMGQLFLMQLFVSVIIDSFSLTEGSGLLTGDQNLVNDMTKYFLQLSPEPKPPVPEGWRSYFYYAFIDVRPLPVAAVQESIAAQHMPQNRRVEGHLALKRQINQARAVLATQTDPDEALKSAKTLQFLEDQQESKMRDLRVFQSFSMEELQCQQLPSGLLHVCGSWFDTVLTVCIIANIACMCTVHYNQSDNWVSFLWMQNLVFNVLFTFEMTFKLIGLGVSAYWQSPFDAFDGFVVIVSWVFAFVDAGAIAGIFRIGRVFRLVKRAPKLQNLMSTLVKTLPSITNVFMVLLLVFFIFAVIGVELFGKIRYGNALNTAANFGSWSSAMHVLWRGALGNWRAVMYDTTVMGADCTMTIDEASELDDGTKYNDCGDYATSCWFFVVFQTLATLCVLNLVVAIILNAFTWCYSLEPSQITAGLAVTSEHFLHFKEIWTRFDLFGTGFIPVAQLQLLMSLVQFNLPDLCRTGTVNQRDDPMYSDYSSFDSSPEGINRDASEAQARENYKNLVDKITRYERALAVQNQILDAGVDLHKGENTDIFDAQIDNGIILTQENCEEAVLLQVRYSTLIMILSVEAVGLDQHDQYVCHQYRDPFRYRVPGYRDDEIRDGKVVHRYSREQQQEEEAKQRRAEDTLKINVEPFSLNDGMLQFNHVGVPPKAAALPPLKKSNSASSLASASNKDELKEVKLPGTPTVDFVTPIEDFQ